MLGMRICGDLWEMYESICGEGCVAAIPLGIGCVQAGMQLRRSGVAAKCLLLGNSTQGIPEECDNWRSFSFWENH